MLSKIVLMSLVLILCPAVLGQQVSNHGKSEWRVLSPAEIYGDCFHWGGVVAGQTTRAYMDKRFGPVRVITVDGEAEYGERQLEAGGQDATIPAARLLVIYDNKSGVAQSIKVEPRDTIDEVTMKGLFGAPDVWILTLEGRRQTAVYHTRHLVIALTPGGDNSIRVKVLVGTAPRQ